MGEGKGLIKKGRFDLKFRGTECRNCGHLLDVSDKFCPNCGQANSTKKLVLKDFLDEFLSSVLNYDSKLLQTLSTMLVRPGTITKDYINGKRVSYTNPFRFLLSLAFLYFLMVTYDSNISNLDDLELDKKIEQGPMSFNINSGESQNDSISFEEQTLNAIQQLDTIEGIDAVPIPGFKLDSLQTLIDEGIKNEKRKDSFMFTNPRAYLKDLQSGKSGGFSERVEFFFTFLQKDSIKSFEEAQEKYGAEDTFENKLAFNGSKSSLKALAQPGTYLNNTIAKLPLVIFFFLPVFTVFILLVYIRKKYTYIDHLIFSFHNQSLLFILLILSWIIDSIFNIATAWIAFMVFSIYLFQAMRKFYGQGVFKTIIKYVFLNSAFLFLALISVVLLFTGSIFTY